MFKLNKVRTYLVLLFIACAPLIISQNSQLANAQLDATIRIGNFAPFEAGDAAIRVEINGIAVVDDFIYGWSTARLDYPSGDFLLEIYKIGETENPMVSEQISLDAGSNYTILFVGDGVNQPFEIEVIDDDLIFAEPSAAAIAFGHFAPLSGNLAGTSIDIRKDNNIMVRDNLRYGVFDPSDIDQLTEILTSYIITSASGEVTFVDLQTFGYNQGDLQYLLLVGDGVNKPIAAYMYVNGGEGGFMSQEGEPKLEMPTIAFANFYSDVDIKSIDIDFMDGAQQSLEYGNVSEDMRVPEGDHSIKMTAPSGEVLIDQTITLGLSEIVIYAITKDNADGDPLLVPVFGDYLSTPVEPPRIKFVHLAPFSTGAFATLDVRLSNGLIIEDDLGFGEEGEFRYLPEGDYTFRYTTRNGDRTLFDPDPITINEGDNLTIFLIGDGEGELIRLLVYVDGEGEVTEKGWKAPLGEYSVAHVAPLGATERTVTRVEIDGETVATGFKYGDFVPAKTVFTGQHEVSVYEDGTGILLASRVVSIGPSSNHAIVLTGDNSNQPFKIEFLDELNVDPTDLLDATVRFGNYSIIPPNSVFDGSSVDLVNGTEPLIENAGYGVFMDNVNTKLPAGPYQMTFQDTNELLVPKTPYSINLNSGDNVILFAIGDGDRQPYGIYAMNADGLNGQLLDPVGSAQLQFFFPVVFQEGATLRSR